MRQGLIHIKIIKFNFPNIYIYVPQATGRSQVEGWLNVDHLLHSLEVSFGLNSPKINLKTKILTIDYYQYFKKQ